MLLWETLASLNVFKISFFFYRQFKKKKERFTDSCSRWSQGNSFLQPNLPRIFLYTCESQKHISDEFNSTFCSMILKLCSSLASSRCLSSGKNALKDPLFKNGNSCAAQITGSDTSSSGSAGILTTQEQLSHSACSLSSYTPDASFRSKDSDPLFATQHHQSFPHQLDNLTASNTQSEGKNAVINVFSM